MYQDLSDQELELVDSICVRYEKAVQDNADTKIDEWLSLVPETIREALLGELIAIQLEDTSLEQIQVERRRFLEQLPDFKDAIREIFDNLQQTLTESRTDPQGEIAGRYRILHRHASGGLGDVYLAHDQELDREVALKQIQSRHSGNLDSRVRFVLEAEVTGRLEHPSIVPVYGLGEYTDGRPYYAMRFIRGKSMKAAIEEFHGEATRVQPSTGHDQETEKSLETQGRYATAESNTRDQESRSKKSLEETGDDRSSSLVMGDDDFSFSISQPDPTENNGDGAKLTKEPGLATQEQLHSIDYSFFELRKLLNRFIDVCQAVSYAHSRGVLHRDLKPANIMLGEFGETFVVDWGLAKLHSGSANSENHSGSASGSADSADATAAGSVVGTLQYMSPEQAGGKLEKLTSQSDVYCLGATLYHLLAGRAPQFGNSISEIRQNIMRGNFAPPRQLQSAIPKPLEAICLKAMSKEPEDRYLGARELADDLERFLADEAVHACVDPIPVRARRWIKKHQTLAAATAVGVVLLLMGLSVFSMVLGNKNAELANLNSELETTNKDLDQKNEQLVVANDVAEKAKSQAIYQAGLAKQREEEAKQLAIKEQEARTKAEKSSERFSKALNLYADSFRSVDPSLGANKWMSANDVLKLAYDNVERTLEDDVQAKSILLDALSTSFKGVGEYELSYEASRKAVRYVSLSKEADDEDLISIHNNMVRALVYFQGNKKVIERAKETLELSVEKLGAKHRLTIRANVILADAYRVAGEYQKYRELCSSLLVDFIERFGERSIEVGQQYGRVAEAFEAFQMFEPALEHYEKAVEILVSETGSRSINSLRARNNHLLCLLNAGEPKKALALCEKLIDDEKEVLEDDHPSTIISKQIYGRLLRANNRKEEGLAVYEQVLEMAREHVGESHPFTHSCINNLALSYEEIQRFDDAEALYKEVINLRFKFVPEDHYDQTQSWDNYGLFLIQQGKVKEAIPLFEKSLAVLEKTFGPDDRRTVGSTRNLGRQYAKLNHFKKAIEIFEKVLPRYEEATGPNSENSKLTLNELGTCHAALGDLDASLAAYQEAYNRRLASDGPDNPNTIEALKWLHLIQLRSGKFEDAIDSINLWLEFLEANKLTRSPEFGWAKASEAHALFAVGEFDKAIEAADLALGMARSWPNSKAHAKSIKGASLAALHPDDLIDAQKLLTQGFDEFEAFFDEIPTHLLFEVTHAGKRLETFLEESEQTEVVEDIKARLAAIRSKIVERLKPIYLSD